MNRGAFYLVNGITSVRIVAFPFLLLFIYFDRLEVFKWVLGICFLTDMVDGFLARKLKVSTELGTRLDSIGDDLTVLAGVAGLWFFKREFLREQQFFIYMMLGLFALQTLLAFIRYGRITSFHTYLAKAAALFQGVFLLLLFFTEEPFDPLFYGLTTVTTLELVEEILLVFVLKEWKTNVRGLYWVWREKS